MKTAYIVEATNGNGDNITKRFASTGAFVSCVNETLEDKELELLSVHIEIIPFWDNDFDELLCWRVGINGNDEIEVEAHNEEEAVELAKEIATESGCESIVIDYADCIGVPNFFR